MARTEDTGRDFHRPSLADAYLATVGESSDGTPTCTISSFPTTVDVLDAEWVLARGDAFVSRAEMR